MKNLARKKIGMRKLSLSWLCILGIALLSSCSEFIEPSIKNKQLILNSPGQNFESNKYSQVFWWEKVENARNYHLQVVSPSFDSVGFLALDTIITGNKFTFTLEPGTYQWRVRGENAGSTTPYVTRSFIIHQSNIASQQVQVIAPIPSLVTNQKDITFKWYALYGSESYRLQIDTNNFSDENKLVFNQLSPATQLTVSLPSDQQYQWRLRAESDSAQSRWTTIYALKYDSAAPGKATLLSPANNALVSKPIELSWNGVADAKKYQVFIYKSDGQTKYNNSYPAIQAGTAHTFNLGDAGETIYWQVRAIDEAGNIGELSEKRSFIIQ